VNDDLKGRYRRFSVDGLCKVSFTMDLIAQSRSASTVANYATRISGHTSVHISVIN
jgi:hypothetical protein